jgi:hypothetical protein
MAASNKTSKPLMVFGLGPAASGHAKTRGAFGSAGDKEQN